MKTIIIIIISFMNLTSTPTQIEEESKYWKITTKNPTDTSLLRIDLNIDMGLGDSVFPGVEREVIEKLNKAFDPVVNELKIIKGKNVARFNTDKLKDSYKKLNNSFMAFIGLDEARIEKILKYARCKKDSQSGENDQICTQTTDYSLQQGSILGSIQDKIKNLSKTIKEKYKESISEKMSEIIEKTKDLEKKAKEGISLGVDIPNLEEATKNILRTGCTNIGDRIKSDNEVMKKMVTAYCDATVDTSLQPLYDIYADMTELNEVNIEINAYFKGNFKMKKVDMCKLMEDLNSNSVEVRLEAKENIRKKLKKLQETMRNEVMKIIMTELIARIPIITIQQQLIYIPMCAMTALMSTTKAAKAAEGDGSLDTSDTVSMISDTLADIAGAGASMFGIGATNAKEDIIQCISSKESESQGSSSKQKKAVDKAVTDNMGCSMIPLVGQVCWTAGILPEFGMEGETNIAKNDEEKRLKNCVGQALPAAYKESFENCMDEKSSSQLFSMDAGSFLPSLGKLSLELMKEKQQQCIFDEEDFEKTIPHSSGKQINVNLNGWLDYIPNMIKPTKEDTIGVNNLYVLKQKLIKLKVEFGPLENESSEMYDFYNYEYERMMGKLKKEQMNEPILHTNALCYLSYNHSEGKTQMGSGENTLHGLLGFDSELDTDKCLDVREGYTCTYNNKTKDGEYNVEMLLEGQSLLGKEQVCTKTGKPTITTQNMFLDGINEYCHKLAKNINKHIDTIKEDYIEKKVCAESPMTSCKSSGDCLLGKCVKKLYATELLDGTDQKIIVYRKALRQFTDCIEITEKIKGATFIKEKPEKEEIRKNLNKIHLTKNLFKVKIGVMSMEELRDDTILFNEYRELFNEKLKQGKGSYIQQKCMNLVEPEDPFNPPPEYVFCKQEKIKLQQRIKEDLINNDKKHNEGSATTDIEQYKQRLELNYETKMLKKRYFNE